MDADTRRRLDLAGLTRVTDGDASILDRLLEPVGQWGVPDALDLDREGDEPVLVWGELWPNVAPDNGKLFERFLGLAEAQPKQVLAFARRYGILNLCQTHRLPYEHCRMQSHQQDERRCEPMLQREPVSEWLRFAKNAQLLLRVAAALHRGEVGDREDWLALFAFEFASPGAELFTGNVIRKPACAGIYLKYYLDMWLSFGGVRPLFEWCGDRPRIVLGGAGFFGAVAMHLVLTVCRMDGFATCSGCGTPFVPRRRPAADRRAWCPECGSASGYRASKRISKRESRARDGGNKRGQA